MSQYARPISDISNTGDTWELSSGSDIYALLDEVTPNDSDYIYTESSDTNTCVLGATSLTDPVSSADHVIRYRYLGQANNELIVSLYQGTTKIMDCPQTGTAGSWTTVAITLTGTQADSITDYGALRFQIWGDDYFFDRLYVSWVELEVPDASGGATLVIADVVHDHLTDAPLLTQLHNLTVVDLLHDHLTDAPLLTQLHNLTVADVVHDHLTDAPSLTQEHVLQIIGVIHTHLAQNVILTGVHFLYTEDIAHSHTVESPTLTQLHQLTIVDAVHTHAVESPTLIQLHVLGIADAAHAHTLDPVAITLTYSLAVADLLHSHTLDPLTLAVIYTLVVGDVVHAHTAQVVVMGQLHQLAVADALHAHAVDVLLIERYYYPFSDDFTGSDGDPWDTEKWDMSVAA